MSIASKEYPLVSIVIPCYNHAQFVQDAIQSVIDQDYENIELIIIDDGSKDNSVEVIQQMVSLCEKRFTRFEFRYRPNKGLCATLNEALEWCKGKFFAPVASDDILRIGKTSLQVNYLNNNDAVGVFGAIQYFRDMQVISLKEGPHSSAIIKYRFNDIYLHKHNLPAPSQMLITESIRASGGYLEGLIIEDWYLWLALTKSGSHLDYIDTVVADYRRHNDNISSKAALMNNGRIAIVELFKDSPLYSKALSRAYLMGAHDFFNSDIKQSAKLAICSLINNYKVFFDLSFYKVFLKIGLRIVKLY